MALRDTSIRLRDRVREDIHIQSYPIPIIPILLSVLLSAFLMFETY